MDSIGLGSLLPVMAEATYHPFPLGWHQLHVQVKPRASIVFVLAAIKNSKRCYGGDIVARRELLQRPLPDKGKALASYLR